MRTKSFEKKSGFHLSTIGIQDAARAAAAVRANGS